MGTFESLILKPLGLKKDEELSKAFEESVFFEDDPVKFINDIQVFLQRTYGKKTGGTQKILFDFSKTNFLSPATAIYLAALSIKRSTLKNDLSLRFKENSKLHEFLHVANFDKVMQLPPFPNGWTKKVKKELILPLYFSDQIPDAEALAEWYLEKICDKYELSAATQANIVDCISELLRNVKQHSDYTQFFMIGQSYPETKKVRFVIYDNGNGIQKRLTKFKYANQHKAFKKEVKKAEYVAARDSNALAIKLAAKNYVSATEYKENSGWGLYFSTRELLRATDGKTLIISNDGLVLWDKDGIISSEDISTGIRGTLVSVTSSYI